jgi:hypothetical protein
MMQRSVTRGAERLDIRRIVVRPVPVPVVNAETFADSAHLAIVLLQMPHPASMGIPCRGILDECLSHAFEVAILPVKESSHAFQFPGRRYALAE